MVRIVSLLVSPLALTVLLIPHAGAQSMSCTPFRESDLVEEWRYLPSESAPAEQLLGQPEWIARSRSGDSFVLDAMQHRVVRIDASGRYRGGFGGRGAGPGQFLNPVSVRTLGDEVAVLDVGSNLVNVFSPEGELQRTIRLAVPVYRARDFLLLSDGRVAVSGSAAGSNHLVHLFRADGTYEAGLSSVRMDLTEPVLRERFSGAALAELPGNGLAVAHRTPFRFEVYRNGRGVTDRTDAGIVPDYAAKSAWRVGQGWGFNSQHPKLTTLLPLDGGCFLVAVQVPPDEGRAAPSDYRTHLYVLDASGRLASHVPLGRFFWGTQIWRDGSGVHVLGLGLDRETDLLYPVQYRLRPPATGRPAARARVEHGNQGI